MDPILVSGVWRLLILTLQETRGVVKRAESDGIFLLNLLLMKVHLSLKKTGKVSLPAPQRKGGSALLAVVWFKMCWVRTSYLSFSSFSNASIFLRSAGRSYKVIGPSRQPRARNRLSVLNLFQTP